MLETGGRGARTRGRRSGEMGKMILMFFQSSFCFVVFFVGFWLFFGLFFVF